MTIPRQNTGLRDQTWLTYPSTSVTCQAGRSVRVRQDFISIYFTVFSRSREKSINVLSLTARQEVGLRYQPLDHLHVTSMQGKIAFLPSSSIARCLSLSQQQRNCKAYSQNHNLSCPLDLKYPVWKSCQSLPSMFEIFTYCTIVNLHQLDQY